MNTRPCSILPALLACVLAATARAQGDPNCPNVRASEVPARVDHQGEYQHCGLGLHILGVSLTIGGAKCYRNEFIYPSHQECLGAASPGTLCDPEGSLPVIWNTCQCLWLGVLGTGVGVPKCDCTSAGTAGTVEDSRTMACPGIG